MVKGSRDKSRKVTISLSPAAMRRVEELSAKVATSRSEVIRRLIMTLQEVGERPGGLERILLQRADGTIDELDLSSRKGPIATDQVEGAHEVEKQVSIVGATPQLLRLLRRNPRELAKLTPAEFEEFVCDRLFQMGLDPQLVGGVTDPDGGVDIVACPRVNVEFPFLIAVQVKHHSGLRKTGPSAVKDLQAVLAANLFNAGVLVTNTTFTPHARWWARQRPHIVRLRDVSDMVRWMEGEFLPEAEWRELPSSITLAPGIQVPIRRPRG